MNLMKLKKTTLKIVDKTLNTNYLEQYEAKRQRYEVASKWATREVNRTEINHVQHQLNKYKADNIQDYDVNYTARIEALIDQMHKDVVKDVLKMANIHKNNASSRMEQKADIDFIKWVKEAQQCTF